MRIPIKTNKDRYHREILEVIKSLPPLNNLRNKELDLLAEIMKNYQEYPDVPKDQRKHIVFSTENRKKIQKELTVSKGNMNTYLVKLRKYKLLNKDNGLPTFLDIPYTEFDINFKFVLNGG
jgi:hypothetical protein